MALRLGPGRQATEVWEGCLDHHRREEDLQRVGDLHRKIGAALWHKGDREGSIEHYQRGIDLLKDGPPCLELVRLYEEAASLYMHTGDNMLAIYASEKALRLAERLGEAAAASRAHGIFGRVFGRIGDAERARENLERSVELARESDPAEAVRALLTLGYHLEVSEADYAEAATAYEEALGLAEQTGDLPSQVELHAALAQLAEPPGRLGCGRERDRCLRLARRTRGPDRQAVLPVRHARDPALARGQLRRGGRAAAQRSRARRAGGPIGGRVPGALLARSSLRQRGDYSEADTELSRALDICERAGLVAQSVEAISARALNLMLAGRGDAAREAAEEAERLAERLRYPVGQGRRARGGGRRRTPTMRRAGAAALEEARAAWLELGRPLDAARCEYIRGIVLAHDGDERRGREALELAAEEAERYGVDHLARLARRSGRTQRRRP